jgi:serine/threonine-protein kinase HipA
MNKPTEIIAVKMQNKLVGRLVLSPEGLAVFEYDAAWLKNGFSISPFYLPLQQGAFVAKRNPFQGNFGVFADSLPDGWGNLLLDRVLKKNSINPNSLSILNRLSLVGSFGMGAICYEPEQSKTRLKPSGDLIFLAVEVANILKEKVETDALELLQQLAGSSAGARPKVMIKYKNEHWLVKFPSSSDPNNIGETEYKYSLLAKKAGLEMPETHLFEGKYFGVKRFDRIFDERLHIHSAAGLLHADFRLPALDYTELIKATRGITRNTEEVEKMYRLMVFNVLIGNKDDHAKNFSFIYHHPSWKCSPVYDVLPSSGFNGQHSTTIAGQGNPTVNDMFEVANQTSISHKRAQQIYEDVSDALST